MDLGTTSVHGTPSSFNVSGWRPENRPVATAALRASAVGVGILALSQPWLLCLPLLVVARDLYVAGSDIEQKGNISLNHLLSKSIIKDMQADIQSLKNEGSSGEEFQAAALRISAFAVVAFTAVVMPWWSVPLALVVAHDLYVCGDYVHKDGVSQWEKHRSTFWGTLKAGATVAWDKIGEGKEKVKNGAKKVLGVGSQPKLEIPQLNANQSFNLNLFLGGIRENLWTFTVYDSLKQNFFS